MEGVAGSLEVADPVVGLDLILVDLEVVLAVLVVAAGPGVSFDPNRGLGLGRVLVLVELEAVLAELEVAAGPGVGLDPACGLGLEVVLVVLEVATGPGVSIPPLWPWSQS